MIVDNYISEKIRLVSNSALMLKKIAEYIKRKDKFQDEYIDEFNAEIDELIYTANNLKINKE
jgi:hypothetical protein|tara:strand:- start:247 stop:432 length:186 start_codon:yes stop_codon:yes gene_type:complete